MSLSCESGIRPSPLLQHLHVCVEFPSLKQSFTCAKIFRTLFEIGLLQFEEAGIRRQPAVILTLIRIDPT